MDITRSDKSRCRPPKSEWSLDDRTDRTGSGAEWGWVGRPLRRLPRFATDGRGRMREATLHHNMDGWLGGSTNPSRSPLLVSQLASQSGKEGRERHFSGRRGRRVVGRLVCGPISFFSRKTDWPCPACCLLAVARLKWSRSASLATRGAVLCYVARDDGAVRVRLWALEAISPKH